MHEVLIERLKSGMKFDVPLLHQSGITLLESGEMLSDEALSVMKNHNIEKVYVTEKSEKLEVARRNMLLMPVKVDEIKEGHKLARSIYDTSGTLLLEEGATIPKRFAISLQQRGINEIYYRKSEEQLKSRSGREVREMIEPLVSSGKKVIRNSVRALDNISLQTVSSSSELVESKVVQKIEASDNLIILPDGEALEKELNIDNKMVMQDEEEKKAFLDIYEESLESTASLFHKISNSSVGNIDGKVVRSIAQNTIAGLIRNRQLMMVASSMTLSQNYLVSHSLAVAIAAINIGTAMGFSKSQILSIGYGALLHDVGMLRVNPSLRDKQNSLSKQEWQEIMRHPSHGLDMLQRISGIPIEVPFVVYQSHERVNGSGYPRGKKDAVIHTYAKIVAVADIYNSICSHRPYREAKSPYEAMEQIVLMCGKRLIDSKVVKAFLQCNSMFPVGSWVELSDQSKARVVAADPENYMKPFVSVIYDSNGVKVRYPFKQKLAENNDLKIVKALADGEVEPVSIMEGF